jgi:hypothetical protein
VQRRPATLSKDILTQAEVLIALRMTGPRDVAAIDEWVRLHADEDEAREVKSSLASLPVGTAWVWSPGWLDLLRRVQIRLPRTFDSSSTPRPGQKRLSAKAMAPIDLAALGEQITATVERGKAEDPRQLRRTIEDLQRQLRTRAAPAPAETVTVTVPVLDAHCLTELRGAVAVYEFLRRGATRCPGHDQRQVRRCGGPGTSCTTPAAITSCRAGGSPRACSGRAGCNTNTDSNTGWPSPQSAASHPQCAGPAWWAHHHPGRFAHQLLPQIRWVP